MPYLEFKLINLYNKHLLSIFVLDSKYDNKEGSLKIEQKKYLLQIELWLFVILPNKFYYWFILSFI